MNKVENEFLQVTPTFLLDMKNMCDLAADTAMLCSYAPYSNYHVGAVIVGEDGDRTVGANVENMSYGLTICAERVAMANFIIKYRRLNKPVACIFYAKSDKPVTPCGACLQVLLEFMGPESYIIHFNGTTKTIWKLREILPFTGNDFLDSK